MIKTIFPARHAAGRRTGPADAQPAAVTVRGKQVGYCPANQRAARQHTTWQLWNKAGFDEMQGLINRKTFITGIQRSSLPATAVVIGSMFTYKDKLTGPKARIVARGDQLPKLPSHMTLAPTPHPAATRLLFALSAQHGHTIHHLDASQAFSQAHPLPPGLDIYMTPPPGCALKGEVWKIVRPLYGLTIAPKAWSDTLREFLLQDGWTACSQDPSLYIYTTALHTSYLSVWVDDILLSFHDDDAAFASSFSDRFLTRFEGKNEGPVTEYLGMVVHHPDQFTYTLDQSPLIESLLDQHDMSSCNPVSLPMDPHAALSTDGCPVVPDIVTRTKYRSIVGTCLHLSRYTRPDIGFATQALSRYVQNPSPAHLSHAKHLLRYLRGTATMVMTFTASSSPSALVLRGFSDADWAQDRDSRKSVSGWIFYLGDNAISWSAKQQSCTAGSTCEAEFIAASNAADEVVWLRRLLADLHCAQLSSSLIYEDSQSCIKLALSLSHRSKTKHIDLRLFRLRERIQDGDVHLHYCPTADMAADPLTKALPGPAFYRHRPALLGRPTTGAFDLLANTKYCFSSLLLPSPASSHVEMRSCSHRRPFFSSTWTARE